MQWKKEIQAADIKLKEDETELSKAVNLNRHLVLTMAHQEMAERNKRGLNETYRPAKVGEIDSQYVTPEYVEKVSAETIKNREKRAKQRALKRRTIAGNNTDNNTDNNNEIILKNDNASDDKIS